MNLEKLFGSKTKVDILKYLLFKRQGVSMRALEHEIPWTFPAIKKQVDSLKAAKVIDIDKEGQWRSITIKEEFSPTIKSIFFFGLKLEVINLFQTYEVMIDRYYFGKTFGNNLDMDLVVIHKHGEKPQIEAIKESISDIFKSYYIDIVSVVFMSADEREKRYRLADKFVLHIMRNLPNQKEN